MTFVLMLACAAAPPAESAPEATSGASTVSICVDPEGPATSADGQSGTMPHSTRRAEELAWRIHDHERRTFDCACRYEGGAERPWEARTQPETCEVPASVPSEVRWRRVVPRARLQEHFRCGAHCNHAAFRDLANLVPARARSPLRFCFDDEEPTTCATTRTCTTPASWARGDIARIAFYMEHTYGITLRDEERTTLERWAEEDAPDDDEERRWSEIRALQGRGPE